ncbi:MULTISPECIES: cytochrome c nitrite reductase pentaheme subunit [Vibrio]|uniref:cytochrome c nitrite reductase pentaheme subunit n=1 Tax=Vibrio TaxID=662 RepID=UPI0001B99285|nr:MULTISPECIES: cytochrome c nitrite reductase pentaheme subunit [Vibrio]EEX66594.1 cytochrome c-type protein nrfB precursor [Vibrio metoecus]PAR56364.1 cytochrome c nitrite reductase pentaheme subunit [Vibrio metoecus]RBM36489.1 cytochrome c nitrite reductase pentaheme subunit [Vibrio tarriae]
MGKVQFAIAIMLKSLLAFCLYGYSIYAVAESSDKKSEASPQRHEVTFIRDADYKCVQCHKDAKNTLLESHSEQALQQAGRELNCTNCHSNIGPEHRNGAEDVTKYFSAQSQPGNEKVYLEPEQILQANSVCMDCHQPEKLREKSWTHDVHAKNLTCSNCHTVHAMDAKVLSFDHKQKIKLCVDCHSDFKAKEEEK